MQSPTQLLVFETLSKITKQLRQLRVSCLYLKGLDKDVRHFHTPTKIAIWDGLMSPNTRSLNGYRLDTLKSWLQKSIRRGQITDAVYAAYELDTLGRPARTNMWNRIIKIAIEDIGVANRDALDYVMKCYNTWSKYSETPTVRDPLGQAALARAVTYLCQSSKIRLVSDIKATYSDHYPEIVKQYPMLYLNITDDYKESKLMVSKSIFISTSADWAPEKYVLDGDPPELLRLITNFIGYLYLGSDRTFYWAYQILKLDKCAKRDRRTSPANVLWNILNRLCHQDYRTYITSLYMAYKSQATESTMFLIQAILLFMRPSRPEQKWVEKDYARMWSYNTIDDPKKVPDYAVDMHTKDGRRMGADQIRFANEGAEVADEWKELVSPEMRKIYRATKNVQVYGTLTTDVLLVAQLATSPHKKLVRLYPDKVTKGPYSDIGRIKTLYQKLKTLKSPIIDMAFVNHLGDWYIEMPQMATKKDWQIGEPTKSLSKTGPKFVRVVDRESMGISMARLAVLNDEMWFWIYIHLIHRLILGIGDSHLNNLIVVDGKVYGTDFDEVRPQVALPANTAELEAAVWSMKPVKVVKAQGFQAFLRLRERLKKYLMDANYQGSVAEDNMLARCIRCL